MRATISVGSVVGVVLALLRFLWRCGPGRDPGLALAGVGGRVRRRRRGRRVVRRGGRNRASGGVPVVTGERLLPRTARATISTTTAPTISIEVTCRGRRFMESRAWRCARSTGKPAWLLGRHPAPIRSDGLESSKTSGRSGSGNSSFPRTGTGGTAPPAGVLGARTVAPGRSPTPIPAPPRTRGLGGPTRPDAAPERVRRRRSYAVGRPPRSERCSRVPRAEW